jgi:hypothetical protein
VHVIGHQAVTEELQIVKSAVRLDQVKVGAAIRVASKDPTLGVASLGDVMRNARHNGARKPGHSKYVPVH